MRLSAPLRAAVMMTFCCAFVALSTFLAKMLGRGEVGAEMHAFQIVLGRYLFAFLPLCVIVAVVRPSLKGAPWPVYAGRSVCGTGGVTGLFAAAMMIPLADATAISFLNPVFAMILAIPLLGERIGPERWIAAGIALSGGLLLIRPGVAEVETGALIALGAAAFMAAEIIFAKILARRETVLRMLFCTNLFSTSFALFLASFVWRAPSGPELAMMVAVGLTMLTAQALFMATIRFADASFATPFFYGTLLFAALYDAVWFGTIPAPLSIAGAALIITGAVLLAIREARASRAPAAPAPMPPADAVKGGTGGERAH